MLELTSQKNSQKIINTTEKTKSPDGFMPSLAKVLERQA